MIHETTQPITGAPESAESAVRWPLSHNAAPVPDRMSAVAFDAFGAPDVLTARSVPVPQPGAGEVLIRVASVSVGRLLDLGARAGRHPHRGFQLPHVLGAEHAGTVAALGAGVSALGVGDRVAVFPVVDCGACDACRNGMSEACPDLEIIGIHRPGAYAQYCVVPARNVRPLASDTPLTPPQVAALALAGPVAMNQLIRAGFTRGAWVLVQAGASALGTMSVALAAHLGANVIATSRSATKRAAILRAGAVAALDATAANFVDEVREITDGRGADIVVDNLGEPLVFAASFAALAPLGTLVSSGAFFGGRVEVDLGRLYLNNQRIVGVRTANAASVDQLWTAVDNGLRPTIDRVFPLSEAAQAHAYLDDSGNTGRVVLAADDLMT
jgi:NADPH:quinone reductase-like Zn-dependent oxidoreductase